MKQQRNRVTFTTYVLMMGVIGALDFIRSTTWITLTVMGLAISVIGNTLSAVLTFLGPLGKLFGVGIELVQMGLGLSVTLMGIGVAFIFTLFQFVITNVWLHFLGVSMLERGVVARLGRSLGLGFIPFSGMITTYLTLKHIEDKDREYNSK